jgi:hypothetical protein
LKVAELANTPCDYLSEVATLIDKAKRRMQRKPELIQGNHSGKEPVQKS